ncbi:hypothetical protein GOBAR_DD19293 [Gossypium barbadense]|nr:hypothetical protein GOBAR_DD19293 [Gossypium barbadense]
METAPGWLKLNADGACSNKVLITVDGGWFNLGRVHGRNKGRGNSPVGHTGHSSSQQKQGIKHPNNMALAISISDGSLDFGNDNFARLTTDKSNDYYH